jgi:lipopolysaccharide transport system ATP-binding protein
MTAPYAIRVEEIGKRYLLGQMAGVHGTLRDAIAGGARGLVRRGDDEASSGGGRRGFIWALRDVSFEVAPGELLGVIGRNGAGKTTLLKLLSRVTEPTEGRAHIVGSVGSLLEVGTGFHLELTGRENLYLSGAVYGMKRADIRRRFEEIIEFAGIGPFIDTPVKRYSSGMYVRLAFSVAAHLETEILLMDEVLAVGDYQFQKKCLGKMGEVATQGRTVLLVSHSMPSIRNFCSRAILLDAGGLVADGPTDAVVDRYMRSSGPGAGETVWADRATAPGGDVCRLRSVRVLDADGVPVDEVDIGRQFSIEMTYWNLQDETRLCPHVEIRDGSGTVVLWGPDLPSASQVPDPLFDEKLDAGLYRSVCTLPGELLNDGEYAVTATVASDITTIEAKAENCATFGVRESGAMRYEYSASGPWPGVVRPRLDWRTEKLE